MRRLINWIYRTAFGLHLRSHEQHIEDLRQLLFHQHHEKRLLQAALDAAKADVDATTKRLLSAIEKRDAASKRRQQATHFCTTTATTTGETS